jgi:hypothetical protein
MVQGLGTFRPCQAFAAYKASLYQGFYPGSSSTVASWGPGITSCKLSYIKNNWILEPRTVISRRKAVLNKKNLCKNQKVSRAHYLLTTVFNNDHMAAVKPQPCQPSQLRLGYNSFIR